MPKWMVSNQWMNSAHNTHNTREFSGSWSFHNLTNDLQLLTQRLQLLKQRCANGTGMLVITRFLNLHCAQKPTCAYTHAQYAAGNAAHATMLMLQH